MAVTRNLVKGVSVPFVKNIIRYIYLISSSLIREEIIILTTEITSSNINVARCRGLGGQSRCNNGINKKYVCETSGGMKFKLIHI